MKISKTLSISLIIVLTAIIGVIFSCKKGDVTSAAITADATILDEGSLASDGCGWLIRTDADSTYFPVNLTTQYQVNNMKVHITYRTVTQRYFCGMVPFPQNKGITEITLDKIAAK